MPVIRPVSVTTDDFEFTDCAIEVVELALTLSGVVARVSILLVGFPVSSVLQISLIDKKIKFMG